MRDLARGDGGRQGGGLGPFLFHPCTHPAQLSGTCSDGDTPCSDGDTLAVTIVILAPVFYFVVVAVVVVVFVVVFVVVVVV